MKPTIDYEAVFKAGQAPSLILTPDLVIVAANDAYLKVVGRTAKDLLGRPLFAAFPPNPGVPPDAGAQGADSLRTSLEQVLTTRRRDFMPLQRYDVEAPGRPGVFEERYWSTVNTPVLGPYGEVLWIILSTEEVTDLVQTLRRSPADAGEGGPPARDVDAFARGLQALNEELRQAHREQRETTSALREAIERQRRLVFEASHDLRNPITGLMIELECALSEPGIDLQRILRKSLCDAERLNDIVADLLDLARVDTESGEPPAQTVDLAELVTDELNRRVSGAAVAVHTRLAPDVLVRASRIRLARLLGNLMANAERHARTKIEIHVCADPPDAVLEVADDGPGIPPADRERIFERMYRRREARERDPGGSGLGLTIARAIAEMYGGTLCVADSPVGARLVLRLPLAS
ncbi:PAS domain-containing sensor histidine kinase [Microbispora triticiradicis]|uniref:PAS domain-containing sensor histidine kinase n=1 Tax=Microbispora triticiradicis TaxID=2200763 RepID=UPI001AD6D7DB|nr:PAS domain-containing sensor histidine kinase [Microbispora triticiradicis]MBO4272359.1 PAS domain-containing protein [Microbispora triticiradicis]